MPGSRPLISLEVSSCASDGSMRDCNILKVDTINSKPINCFRYTCLFQKILLLHQ